MNERISPYKYLLLTIALLISFATSQIAIAQHEGHDMSKMPGMSKPKPKAKTKAKRKVAARKRKRAAGSKEPAKKHDMSKMPGMNMPDMQV
ncbi:MAG TPA: hypothetical protein VE056_00635, partial [Pyrinomonadaceae bacterium]|nr:hypothetical protein [Pyrinomonadaceae bacterium]